ncbi:GGDEF domain-containing protein [Pararhizobium mangrovi]|uniref:diguanylate cyclase n=1 Tax=Pararhizobium mangrovi TaxID=2590452 RepID=A0A506U7L6_9HYPH|nr:GGDEF domain-containing protein [Pararhizobium mangrovi]TPW30343.1 GGDEF domain-containing protein [Pararhizobium mangrovi]
MTIDRRQHFYGLGRLRALRQNARLHFEPELESTFRSVTAGHRRSQLIFISACIAIFCLAAIPLDFLEHSRPALAASIRIGLLLPVQLIGIFALRFWRSDWSECLAMLIPITAAVLTVDALGYLTEVARPDVAERYYLASGSIAFTFNFVAPLRFRHAVLTTLAVLLVYDVHLFAVSSVEMQPTAIFVTVIALFSLITRWRLERAERNEFLGRRAQAKLNGELVDLTERLTELASTDPLTGLANRRRLQDVLRESWEEAERNGEWVGAAIADIDHFKRFNDAVGHFDGDECLKTVASRLAAVASRAGGTIARFGGEEFAILAPDADPDAILRFGEELRHAVDQSAIPHPGLGENRHVTVSVGVSSTIPIRDIDAGDVLRAADAALYEAKQRGRDMVVGRETTAKTGTPQERPTGRKSSAI